MAGPKADPEAVPAVDPDVPPAGDDAGGATPDAGEPGRPTSAEEPATGAESADETEPAVEVRLVAGAAPRAKKAAARDETEVDEEEAAGDEPEEAEETTAAGRRATKKKPVARETAARKRRRRVRQVVTVKISDPVLTVAAALALAALACAVWFGMSWFGAAHDDSRAYSRLRDEVLRSGRQAVINLNTLDYRNFNEGLRNWQNSTTAELYQEIVQGRSRLERDVTRSRTVSSAKVLEAALTELDDHAGKASIIAAVQLTVTPGSGQPAVQRVRLMGQLTKTSTGWKLSALGRAPVGTSGN